MYYVARTRTSIIRRPILTVYDYSADYIRCVLQSSMTHFTFYNSRDLNPKEPAAVQYESWLREQKGVEELSGCMGTTVCAGMFM